MSQTLKRWMMRQTLTAQPEISSWRARPISQQDGPLLGELVYAAYHNTIDDEGETPEEASQEIEDTLTGKYGPALLMCSFLVEEQGRALGASVLSAWTDKRTGRTQPLLCFIMTHPDARGKGMATFLLQKSINALLARGEQDVVLFVTVGNDAALHIYQKLGFQVEEEFETDRVKSV
ncbi:MAG TPA: GNAT family N-acetyltransferase [Ktedonobacteraceae bacterium]|jgi:ribosomal protein S18 acetylase RimI-like enzyme|nr:GNAT family N-acetyltransferase [Ktedonobacteraceae bacterium]